MNLKTVHLFNLLKPVLQQKSILRKVQTRCVVAQSQRREDTKESLKRGERRLINRMMVHLKIIDECYDEKREDFEEISSKFNEKQSKFDKNHSKAIKIDEKESKFDENQPNCDEKVSNFVRKKPKIDEFQLKNVHESVIKTYISSKDKKLLNKARNMDVDLILASLNQIMSELPNRITEFKFYLFACRFLQENMLFLTKQQLILSVFYIGLSKSNVESKEFMRKSLKKFDKESVDNLQIEDLCIICNSAFKTSTKIANKHIQEKVLWTINNQLFILKDAALFVTLIKSIRHNRWQNDDILSTITYGVLFNKTLFLYNFIGLCHLLALYADFLYKEDRLLNFVIRECLQKLRNDCFEKQGPNIIRNKDLQRFLWALYGLGYDELNVNMKIITNNILERYYKHNLFDWNGRKGEELETLIDILFYMWALNCQLVELIPEVLTQDNFNYIRGLKSKTKARFNLLLSVIQFENRELYRRLDLKPKGSPMFSEEAQIEARPVLKRVYRILQNLKNKKSNKRNNENVNKFVISCEVPYLNIVGITGYTKNIYKSVFIEVLDEFVCLKNTKQIGEGQEYDTNNNNINGAMKMKLRILNKLDPALIQIHHEEIEDLNDTELEEYLESEIRLLVG